MNEMRTKDNKVRGKFSRKWSCIVHLVQDGAEYVIAEKEIKKDGEKKK